MNWFKEFITEDEIESFIRKIPSDHEDVKFKLIYLYETSDDESQFMILYKAPGRIQKVEKIERDYDKS